MPIGGLSSSAAVIICFLKALAMVNEIELTVQEYINFALAAEKDYVGVNVGKLDQSCEVLGKKSNSFLRRM
jgi:galactokinase/galacturonokinase